MLKVLLVEDDFNARQGLRELLELEGFCVFCADSGQRALEIARTTSVDVVLADYRLPDMSGIMLSEQVREIHEHAVQFLITAYHHADIQEAPSSGFFAKIFRKPLEIDQLLDELLAVKNALLHKEYGLSELSRMPAMH